MDWTVRRIGAVAAACAVLAAVAAPAQAEPDPKLVAADALFQSGKFQEAQVAVEAILRDAEKAKDPLRIADASLELAVIKVSLGDMAGAEPLLKRTVELRRKALGPEHRETVNAEGQYASWLTFQGRDREAEPILARVATSLEASATNAEERAEAAEARASHADTLFNLGLWEQGEVEMKAALAVLTDPKGPRRPTEMAFLTVLADAYMRWGRYADAQQAAEQALAMREARQGPNHPEVAGTLNILGLIRMTLGDEAQAEAYYKRALQIAEASFPDGPLLAQAVEDLGQFYSNTGRQDQALPLLERALQIREKAGDHTYRLASTWRIVSAARLRAGDGPGADEAIGKAVKIYEETLGPEAAEVGSAKLTWAQIKYANGDDAGGERLAAEGLAIYRKALSPESPRLGDALQLLGLGAERRRDRETAEARYVEALAAMEKRRPPEHEAVINTRASLANQILIGRQDPRRAYETVEPAAEALRKKVLANARLLGKEGAPTLNGGERNVFFISVRAAWAYSESLKAEADAGPPAKP